MENSSLITEPHERPVSDLRVLVPLLVLAFLWTLAPLQGYDFWWYLAVGRDIWEHGEIPWAQSYLGTTAVHGFGAYANLAWLTGLACYLFYALLGPLGLVVLRSGLLTSIYALTYLNCRTAGLRVLPAALWTSLGLWSVRSRFLMRSYLFTDLCLALLVGLLLLYWRERIRFPQLALGTGILFCVWSNCHPGYLAGFVVLALWTPALKGQNLKTSVGQASGLLGVAFLSTLLRPHGIAYLDFFYDHFANPSALGGVLEWGALGWKATLQHHGLLVASCLILVGRGLLKAHRKEQESAPWSYLLVVAAFLFLALRSQRSVAELMPVVVPLAAAFFPRGELHRVAKWLLVLGIAALYLFTYRPHGVEQLQNIDRRYPVHLANSLKNAPGQVLNSYEFGNYLTFARVPPFIHGLTGLYQEVVLKDFLAILDSDDRAPLLDKYEVQSALLHFPTEVDSHEKFVEYLFASPDWKLSLWDDTGLLFLKAPASEGLGHVRPWRAQPWSDPVAARTELGRLVGERPSARAYTYLSELLAAEKDWMAAKQHAQKAVFLNPHDPRAWSALAIASANGGDLEGVLEATGELVELAPHRASVHYNHAMALKESARLRSGLSAWWQTQRFKWALKRALKVDPEFKPAADELKSL